MTAFDPGAVPPADDPLADPAAADLKARLAAARALLDGLRPITSPERFLEADAVEAAALLCEHDLAYFYGLHEELRPHRILRLWLRAVASAAKGLAADEVKVADKLRFIGLAMELLELWHDPSSTTWCWPKAIGPGCCWRMPSREARLFLLKAYGERYQLTLEDGRKVPSTPGKQAVAEALDALEAIAHGGPCLPEPALRVGGDGERLVVDLCNEAYTVVVVDTSGWQIVRPSPIALRRSPGMYPLPLPAVDPGDALGELRRLLGFTDPVLWAQLVAFEFCCLRPTPPYFVLGMFEEQGRGKTTTGRVLRYAVDPHEVEKQPKPKSADDLYVNAHGQWLNLYDNLSSLSQDYSDTFCCISTGATYSKRELYTDSGVIRLKVARPQIITAIVDVVAAPDLLDRALVVKLPEITTLADEDELLAAARALTPRILGQLLEAASLALRDYSKTKLAERVRMVGPARWVEAGAPALGLQPGEFLHAYLESAAHAHEIALEASLVGAALRRMLDHRDALDRQATKAGHGYAGPLGFEGTADALLKTLNEFTSGEPRPTGWPRSPRSMSGQLRRIAPALRKLGYRVEFTRTTDTAHERAIVIDTAHSRACALNRYAPKSASTARDRPNRPNRPNKQGANFISDGSDRSDGTSPPSRISGLSSLEAATGPTNAGGADAVVDEVVAGRRCGYCATPIAGALAVQIGARWFHAQACAAEHRRAAPPKPAEPAAAGTANGAPRPQPEQPLGQRVREARAARGLTQAALAKLASCPQPKVSQIELGRPVSAAVQARVLEALGLT